MSRRFLVLANPTAGGGRALKRLPRAVAELERLGAPHRVVQTRSVEHAAQEAAVAAETGETIAALGGDGLLRPIAGVLRNTGAALAILPGGRGNDFAHVLGVPTDPAAAARLAVEGRERMVDVAEVDGVPYLSVASFGLDSDANRVANDTKIVSGNLVYLYASLRALVAWRPARFTVVVDGERHETTGCTVAVANSGRYGGGMLIAPDAKLDDGRLDVVIVGAAPKLRLLRLLPGVFRGTHVRDPVVSVQRGSVVEVDADRPFQIYADGDPVGDLPATLRVEPRCLRVIVPG